MSLAGSLHPAGTAYHSVVAEMSQVSLRRELAVKLIHGYSLQTFCGDLNITVCIQPS